MHPLFLTFGDFSIRWYGVMAAMGFLTAMAIVTMLRKYVPMSRDEAGNVVFFSIVGGVLGARIYYVIQFYDQFRGRWWDVVRIDKGGLVFFGGFFLALALLIFYCRKRKLDTVRVFDVMAVALPAAHAFGRVGCFLNGCCFGKVTTAWPGVIYPRGSAPYLRYGTQCLHPVQLYEAALNALLALLLWRLLKRNVRGLTLAAYVTAYGLLRFFDEFFRGDAPRALRNAPISPAQGIGIALILAGIALAIYFWRKSGIHGNGNEGI